MWGRETLIEKRKGKMTIKLYGRPTSARTQKVMLALAELGLEYNYILASATMGPTGSVAKGGKPFGMVHTRKYLEMNPTGLYLLLTTMVMFCGSRMQ